MYVEVASDCKLQRSRIYNLTVDVVRALYQLSQPSASVSQFRSSAPICPGLKKATREAKLIMLHYHESRNRSTMMRKGTVKVLVLMARIPDIGYGRRRRGEDHLERASLGYCPADMSRVLMTLSALF
jgi:hypothetical protein